MPGVKDRVNGADFNRRIQFQSNATATQNADGSQTDNWTTVYTCWANFVDKLQAKGYSRALRFFQLFPQAQRVIQIREFHSIKLDAKLRILYPAHGINHVYQILGAENPNDANVSIWFAVVENQAQAAN